MTLWYFFYFPRLSQLCQVKRLKHVVRYNLFPSADMILSLSKEYSIPKDQWKKKARAKELNTEVEPPSLPVRMKRHMPLDIYNREYVRWKRKNQEMQLQNSRDFIQVWRPKCCKCRI